MIENLLNKDEKETVTLIGYQYLFDHYISEAAFFSFFLFFFIKRTTYKVFYLSILTLISHTGTGSMFIFLTQSEISNNAKSSKFSSNNIVVHETSF